MADTIELLVVGQGLLLITFLAMVGLFLLLLFVRSQAGAGMVETLLVFEQIYNFVAERREARGWFTGGVRPSAPVTSYNNDARQRRGWFGGY